ncbi:MAG: zinc carboxypeptidase [Chitinophagaceae bacterium]|nr:zinc carboxypeptidase [Chitinophagaceae bacterium]
MNRTLFFLIFLIISVIAHSQPQSPDQFLGYKLGSRYTPHFQVVNYFKYIAASVTGMVKLEQYGETNEGRPLLLAYIASSENSSRFEAIRMNNLRLAGVALDKMAPDINGPAIIWLSYNVHGNETSSSEAAMLTIYELVNPANNRAKEWLKNTVVIIDPCINPDGRDRYVNWYNGVIGKNANPQPFVREHIEPWPGGRSNHYYFDLNRDWAWQTQVETQSRIVKYNQWLPHVHVDFHEQGYNAPYYFAPAAEPFHDVITAWQREFQTMIGRNNAKYFDENGWLYFTKERFDLFYPSYGDTYPTYKGAIGMTYEQGGSSRAGTAVINGDGDTLTLWDRLYHHYTTGIATIEITSLNANRVVQEFKKYFDKARSAPAGEYKAYVIKTDEGDKINRLKKLLDRNGIDWAYSNAAGLSGFNYFSSKIENFKAGVGDIVVNANQTHSNLLNVLFERNSRLSDSATYDITAWSIPYVYGLQTYGLDNYVTATSKTDPALLNDPSSSRVAYAYAIKWNGLHSARFLSELMKKGIKARYAEQPFYMKGKAFEKGTLLVTRTSNAGYNNILEKLVREAAQIAGIEYTPVETGFVDKGFDVGSDKVRIIKAPKVALIAGENISSLSMGEIWHFFDVQIQYPVNIVWVNDLNRNILKEIDVLIFPDGNYRYFIEKQMNDALKEWVISGGKIIAMENVVAQMARSEWGIKLKETDDKKDSKKDDKKEDYSTLKRYENRERDYIPNNNPGSIFKVELDNSHPLAFGYPDYYYTIKQDDNIYEFFKEGGWNVGFIKKNNFVTGFTGSKTKDKLKDGLLFGVQDMGRGSIIYLSDNPIFRSFWENGKLMFANAVFLVGQ